MAPRAPVRPLLIARLLLVAAGLMMVVSFASLLMPGTELIPDRPSLLDFLAVTTIIGVFAVVGVAIIGRRPGSPVGWLFIVMSLSMSSATAATEYVDRAVVTGWDLPVPQLVAWVSEWSWTVGPMLALPLAIVLFPDGRLPSRAARIVLAPVFILPILTIAATALAPGRLESGDWHFDNPFGLSGAAGNVASAIADSPALGLASFTLPGLSAVIVTLLRMRRSAGTERQQLKWLVLPVAVFVAAIGIAFVTQAPWSWSFALVSFAGLPIAAGIAILRYRLYDIDLVIRRTLVYAVVVAVLGSVYVGLVLALQAALSGIVGGGTIPVAISTLATAALFGPVRRRVRMSIDRRFYRSRYDAERTVEAFTRRLRDEVEFEAVAEAFVDVARQTVRPHGATLWVRGRPQPGPGPQGQGSEGALAREAAQPRDLLLGLWRTPQDHREQVGRLLRDLPEPPVDHPEARRA
ncbi:MAG: hypothetical protein WEE50_04220 [Chloroflexota bacterium]